MAKNYFENEATRSTILKRFSMFDGVGMDLRGMSTYDEALKGAGLGYTGKLVPVMLQDYNVVVPDRYAVVKANEDEELSESMEILGMVGKQYTPVTNREAFSIAEELVNEGVGTYETGGASRGSKNSVDWAKTFLVLRGDTFEIEDDTFNTFIIFNNSFDGSTGINFRVICERIVCMNGMVRLLGGKGSQLIVNIQHSESAFDRIKIAKSVIRKRLDDLQAIKKEAEMFNSLGMTRAQFERKVIPFTLEKMKLVEKDKERERGKERIERVVDQLLQAYNADDVQNYNSAYRAILALSDYETHSAPLRDCGNGQVYLNRVAKGMVLTAAVAKYVVSTFTEKRAR